MAVTKVLLLMTTWLPTFVHAPNHILHLVKKMLLDKNMK